MTGKSYVRKYIKQINTKRECCTLSWVRTSSCSTWLIWLWTGDGTESRAAKWMTIRVSPLYLHPETYVNSQKVGGTVLSLQFSIQSMVRFHNECIFPANLVWAYPYGKITADPGEFVHIFSSYWHLPLYISWYCYCIFILQIILF
jgi:hypothetical protein